jgi:hypothetical protein
MCYALSREILSPVSVGRLPLLVFLCPAYYWSDCCHSVVKMLRYEVDFRMSLTNFTTSGPLLWPRRLIAGFSPLRLGLDRGPVHLSSVTGVVALGQVFMLVRRFSRQ